MNVSRNQDLTRCITLHPVSIVPPTEGYDSRIMEFIKLFVKNSVEKGELENKIELVVSQ